MALSSPVPSLSPATVNARAVSDAVSGILGFQSDAITQRANAAAARASATGYDYEKGIYGENTSVSKQNAILADFSGRIQVLQDQRELLRSGGEDRAAIADAGFQNTGSAVYQLKSSVRQGYLQQQIDRTQSQLDQAGYLEQSRASQSQADAAAFAATGQTTAATSYDSFAGLSDVYAANETTALSKYLKGFSATPESTLATATIAGEDPNNALASAQSVTDPSAIPGLRLDAPGATTAAFKRRLGT